MTPIIFHRFSNHLHRPGRHALAAADYSPDRLRDLGRRCRRGALWLCLAGLLSLQVHGCSPAPVRSVSAPPEPADPVARMARELIGTPYRRGGSSPEGFDCSGLVFFTHRLVGVTPPRTAREQFQAALPVDPWRLNPGDLVFFDLPDSEGYHVGIYVGDRQFVHASTRRRAVTYASLEQPYWRKGLVGAGRLR